MLDTVSG